MSCSYSINNYDVLLTRDVIGNCAVMEGGHVGNRRFTVLLDIHREGYNLARSGGDTTECDRIVDKIINTVCTECVPNGRFLEKMNSNIMIGQDPQWRQLFPPEIKTTVHLALGGGPCQEEVPSFNGAFQANATILAEISRRRDALQRSISESMINFPPPLTPDLARSLSATSTTSQPMSIQENTPSITPELELIISLSNNNMLNMNGSMPSTTPSLSLDRRATAPPLSSLDHQQAAAFQQAARLRASAPNVMNNFSSTSSSIIPETSMDVVFGINGESISTSTHAGNNRFRILVDLQARSFNSAGKNLVEKEQVLEDMLRSVETWSGRFLMEKGSEYQWLNAQQAKECLRKVLNVHALRKKEIDVLKARKQKKDSMRAMAARMAKSDSNLNYNPSDDDDMM